MTEHTPGPWKTRTDYSNSKGNADVWTDESHGSVMIAECRGINKDADARLIAAAPDLLVALEAVRRIVVNQLDNSGLLFPARGDKSKLTPEQAHLRERLSMTSRIARTAIAKVTEDRSCYVAGDHDGTCDDGCLTESTN